MIRILSERKSNIHPIRISILFFAILFAALLSSCPEISDNTENEENNDVIPEITAEELFRQKYLTFADEVPVMRINTAGGAEITSKTDYVKAVISIEGSKKYNLSNWPVEMRGRGNSTWGMPKKPYRIKAESKTSIFGLPAVKNWALIANYADKSLMRNYTVHQLGRSLDSMKFNANVIYIEVYFNGRYDGLYCLQDHTEAKPSRVNVEGFTKDLNGKLTDTGFLIEVDWVDRNPGSVNNVDYFWVGNQTWFLKYPKNDDDGFEDPAFHKQAVDYIRNYVTGIHNAIQAKNLTAFDNLCERDSFIDYFLVQEMSRNVDGAQLSVFANKKAGEKMRMGPLWDFDLALGNAWYPEWSLDLSSPYGWHVVLQYEYQQLPWFRSLMMTDGFYEDFRSRFIEVYDTNILYTINCIDTVRESIRPAAARNFERWKILGQYDWPNPPLVVACKTWDEQVDFVKNFWIDRNEWMYDQLSNKKPIPGVR